MHNNRVIPALLIAIGLSLSGFFISVALSQIKAPQRYVTVKGLAERKVDADVAIWEIRFTNSNDDIAALYDEIAKARTAVMDFLRQQGIASMDIVAQPVQVTDNLSASYTTNVKIKRYAANSAIMVNSKDVAKIRQSLQVTGELVKAGVVVSQSSVRYLYTQLNDIKPEMLKLASENAKAAAEIFSQQAQSALGRIRHASQGLFTIKDADGSYGETNPQKLVRVVTTVQYDLQ